MIQIVASSRGRNFVGITWIFELQAAMENAYNICHNVQDLLFYRGFRWEGAKQKGKGKGRKKGRKSKA